MAFDFEKQIQELQAGHAPVRINSGETTPSPSPPRSASQPEPGDATAVHFPLQVWMLAAYTLAILASPAG